MLNSTLPDSVNLEKLQAGEANDVDPMIHQTVQYFHVDVAEIG